MSLVEDYNSSDEDRGKEEGGRSEPSSMVVNLRPCSSECTALFSNFKCAATVTTKVARLETTKTRSHKGTKKRKSFEILGVLSVFVPLW